MSGYPRPDGFVRAMFAGQILGDRLLSFPQLHAAEAVVVDKLLADFQSFAAQKVDAGQIDRQDHIPDEVRRQMAELGMFGLTVPREHGGLGLSTSAYGRVIEVVTGICPALMLLLGAHLSIGLKGLLLYGNEEQKARYLPRLATGEAIAAFALTEPQTGSDAQSLHTTARREGSG